MAVGKGKTDQKTLTYELAEASIDDQPSRDVADGLDVVAVGVRTKVP